MSSVIYERWLPLSNRIRTGRDNCNTLLVAMALAVCKRTVPLPLKLFAGPVTDEPVVVICSEKSHSLVVLVVPPELSASVSQID